MGAGCYYTLPDNRDIKAYWLDFGTDYDEYTYQDETDFLIEVLSALPLFYKGNNNALYYGKHYRIELKPTYYGDGLLINLVVDLEEWQEMHGLTLANLEKVYNRIIKHINKSASLRVASSGYTSCLIETGSLTA